MLALFLACTQPTENKPSSEASPDTGVVGAEIDDTAETGDTDTGDTDTGATAPCLVLDPDHVVLAGVAITSAYVGYSGCITDIAASCDSAEFTIAAPDSVQYLFVVSFVGSPETAVSGTCTVTSSAASVDLPVTYSPL